MDRDLLAAQRASTHCGGGYRRKRLGRGLFTMKLSLSSSASQVTALKARQASAGPLAQSWMLRKLAMR